LSFVTQFFSILLVIGELFATNAVLYSPGS
jgi:hypothetical protein